MLNHPDQELNVNKIHKANIFHFEKKKKFIHTHTHRVFNLCCIYRVLHRCDSAYIDSITQKR